MDDTKPTIELNGTTLTINVDADDIVANMIKADGFLPSKKLWRRWIMAQMLRFYNDTSLDPTGQSSFDKHFMGQKPYRYAWDTTLNEIKAIAEMPKGSQDRQTRELFYNKDMVIDMLTEYHTRMEKLLKKKRSGTKTTLSVKYPDKNETAKVPCATFARCDMCILLTTDDIDNITIPEKRYAGRCIITQKMFLDNIAKLTHRIEKTRNYHQIERILTHFIDTYPMSRLGNMPKPNAWKNAFRGAGAYYTMDNMIKFHDCVFYTPDLTTKNESLSLLNKKTQDLKPTGRNDYRYYKLYAIMRKFIKDNNFSYENIQE